MSNVLRAHLALAVVNLLYGANYLIAKGLMPDLIAPSGFILARIWGATILFWAILAFKKERIWDKKDLLRIAVCAVFGVLSNQLLFFHGLNLTSPGNASIIMTSSPILVLILSSFILKLPLTKTKIAGILIGATGAILLILYKENGAQIISSPLGDLLVFLNAFSYGLYLVLVKPLMKKYKPLTVITYVFSFGAILVLPFGWESFSNVDWNAWQPTNFAAFAFVIIGVTFLAYLLNLYSLQHVEPTVTSSYIYFQPLITIVLAYLVFYFGWGEDYTDLTWYKVSFALMIFAGVYLTSKKQVKKSIS